MSKSQTAEKSSSQQRVSAMTPVEIPLGLIQIIDSYLDSSTGPVGTALQIKQQLQIAVDAAGLGNKPAS